MAPFEDYIFSTFAAEINSWEGAWVQDVYALGFLISLEDQDPRLPTIGLVYNTNRQWENSTAGVLSEFADGTSVERLEGIREETKWLFDFWLQHSLWIRDELTILAKSRYGMRLDPQGALLRQAWINSLNLWYTDEEEDADFDRALQMGGQITDIFDAHCVRVAQRLHTEGIIEAKFGHAIPIVFHGPVREYHLAWCARNANPSGLAGEFEQYVLKGCSPEFLVECARYYENGRRGAAAAASVPVQREMPMLDVNGIAEEMRVEGLEVTTEDVAEVHQGLKDGRTYTGALDREIVRLLQRQLAQAMGDGEVENAGF